MTVTSTSSSTGKASSTSAAGNLSTVLATKSLDIQDFYTLLTAELKYQDPMDPTSNSEFMAQTAQFASLQEAQTTNDLLKALSTNFLGSQVLSAAQAIGKYARASTDSGEVFGTITAVAVDGTDVKVTIGGTNVKVADLRELAQEG